MIRTRIIDINGDKPDRIIYQTNSGLPMTEQEAQEAEAAIMARPIRKFECPACRCKTFGCFEPFIEKGINKWCSICGYSEFDIEKRNKYLREHPEEVQEEILSIKTA